MPNLMIKQGLDRGTTIQLQGERASLGRAPGNDARLEDPTVSRYHAVLLLRDGEWHLKDLGGRNGTLVNGQPVASARLSHCDEVRLGNVLMEFREDDGAGGEPTQVVVEDSEARKTVTIPLSELPGLLDELDGSLNASERADQRLGHLLALTELAATARALASLFDGIIDSLRRTLPAERVVPVLVENGSLRPYLGREQRFGEGVDDLDLNRSVLDRAMQTGPARSGGGEARGPISACAPIRIGTRCLGLIYCDRPPEAGAFTDDDLRYLFSIALGTALAIENIRDHQRMARRAEILDRQLGQRFDMVGDSEPMQAVYEFIRKVAPTDAGVLICGESGVGKEMVARAIHRHSRRSEGPLEIVNCAALQPTLIESELFGHLRGAFTGALADRPGRFELADGGTLFLDEIVELPPECQTKLLRVLESHEIRRVGATTDSRVDVRLIAATNRDPDQAVREGQLRQDLFYRLDRLRITVPPLRQRGDDIEILAHHFLESYAGEAGRHIQGFDEQVLQMFGSYEWPGNVRELRNLVERMVILEEGPILGGQHLPDELTVPSAGPPTGDRARSLRDVERDHIERVLTATGGNKKRAAELLGIDRSTLYAKLKRYEIVV